MNWNCRCKVASCSMSLPPCLSHHDGLSLQTRSKTKPFLKLLLANKKSDYYIQLNILKEKKKETICALTRPFLMFPSSLFDYTTQHQSYLYPQWISNILERESFSSSTSTISPLTKVQSESPIISRTGKASSLVYQPQDSLFLNKSQC